MDEHYRDIDVVERIMRSPPTLFIFAQWAMWTMVAKSCVGQTRGMAKHSDWAIAISVATDSGWPIAIWSLGTVDKLSPNVEHLNDVASHASTNEQGSS